jgi:hypothetical protein
MEPRLSGYRQEVASYSQLEYSDTSLQQVPAGLPDKYARKVSKVTALHHQLQKPPSDAAGYAMRIVRGLFRSLITDQEEC